MISFRSFHSNNFTFLVKSEMVDSELLPILAGSRPYSFRETVHPLRPLSRPEIDRPKNDKQVLDIPGR